MRLIFVILAFVLAIFSVQGIDFKAGEFVAGSFILTQKSLDEAPFRYAGVLRQVLDKVERKDPPSQSDEENCNAKYRILPSGRPSRLTIVQDSLSFLLEPNNTLIIRANISAQVSAKTWIWKGINFGLLGCLKLTSCNGDIVKYTANIDLELSLQILWIQDRIQIKIKPVNTSIHDVNVKGCRPPWFLFWFKAWQDLLNKGVQEGFQSFADNYEKQKLVPEEFSPLPNVYVHYVITNLAWHPSHVMFEAKATFSASLNNKNVTFLPNSIRNEHSIPYDNWNMTSLDDRQSHLLQGVRLSTEFINSLMWFASVTNLTSYHGSARVLDTVINGTISYDPPVIRVEEDNLLSVEIAHGLILAECLPTNVSVGKQKPAVLFKAEFGNLLGSGKIILASTSDKTGFRASLDKLDLTRMNTKPFEPKLPLPEAFESQLMKSVISQLQPVVNQYLQEKPMFLPDHIAPLAAAPLINLWSTGNGTGYAEILSYCTCDKETNTPFALCDERSNICAKKKKATKTISDTVIPLPTNEKVSKIEGKPENLVYNFTNLFSHRQRGNLSYVGFHLTIFEKTSNCKIEQPGDTAKVFWLWETSRCTPLYLNGKFINEYYKLDGPELKLMCDSACSQCQQEIKNLKEDKSCGALSNGGSYQQRRPLIYSWQQTQQDSMTFVANIFFSPTFCAFYPSYIEPQILSSHINLGLGNETCQNSISFQLHNDTFVKKAFWECNERCYGCFFRLEKLGIDNCHNHNENINIVITKSIPKHVEKFITIQKDHTIYAYIGGSFILLSIILISTLIIYKKRDFFKEKLTFKIDLDLKGRLSNAWKKFISIFGIRFKLWKDSKMIREDVIQNSMLLANGTLAIIFAFEWNSDNNPLLIINNKFKSGLSISMDIFTSLHMTNFADSLNFFTCLVNIINAILAFTIVLIWTFTTFGSRIAWMKIRLLSCASFLASIFVVLASMIFTTYFDHLLVLEKNKGFFVTDNESMHDFASQVLKVSLNGLSLTVISFTIVFLFHGVGGGLFCGTVLFRSLHLGSKTQNMEVLTTLLVILTIIQPFICLHPVIIWSQDSQNNSNFLILIILIWFLPLVVHTVVKSLLRKALEKCQKKKPQENNAKVAFRKRTKKVDVVIVGQNNTTAPTQREKFWLMASLDIFVQVIQLALFVTTFSVITHYIINTEFAESKVQKFILPAIISVFVWMMSISYLLLSLVMDESRTTSRLVFKDQDLEKARNQLRQSLRRRLHDMDSRSFRARSLQRQTMIEASEKLQKNKKKGQTLPNKSVYMDLSASSRSTKSNYESPPQPRTENEVEIELLDEVNVTEEVPKLTKNGFCGKILRIFHFFAETMEYKDPNTFGWRIKFRRIFLTLGTMAFTFQTIQTALDTQNYSSKKEIQDILDYLGTNLTWPDSGSVLDEVFDLYNIMEKTKSYLMIFSSFLFWIGLILDFCSHFVEKKKSYLYSGSRIVNFLGSLTVFASVIIVGLPDYLEASNLDTICPFCGTDFNRTVRQVAEFSIGLFFACLFTFQLIPILVTIGPALVRASVLILIHPALQIQEGEISNLRMTILQQVIQFSSILTFPVTFISMAILQQYQKDFYVTLIIVAFWSIPPILIYIGLHFSQKYRRYTILLGVYYLYNWVYVSLLFALVFYSMTLQRILEVLEKLLQEPTFWTGSIAQIFLCNVVISDLLYMTVF